MIENSAALFQWVGLIYVCSDISWRIRFKAFSPLLNTGCAELRILKHVANHAQAIGVLEHV